MSNSGRVLAIIAGLAVTASSNAEWTGNVGWASDYYYRGIFQADSSASAGLDFEKNGFYAGSWAADVGDGLEVDIYAGFNGELGDFSYGVGFTGYYYTQTFDDTYEELNISVAYGIARIEVALGQYDNFGNGRQNYNYYALMFENKGLYVKYAGFARNFSGDYVEFGYAASVSDVDIGLSLILGNDELLGKTDESLVFAVSKTFDF